jgi:hypothetical protein
MRAHVPGDKSGAFRPPRTSATEAPVHGLGDILYLQRTIGNRATTQLLIDREFAGDIAGADVQTVVQKLKDLYPDQVSKVKTFKLAPLQKSSTKYSLQDVAKQLGLKASPAPVVIAIPKPSAAKNGSVEVEDVALTKPEEAVGTETTFNLETLLARVASLFSKRPSPQKEDFMALFKSLYAPGSILGILQSSAFAYGFQALIREQLAKDEANKTFLEKTKITDLRPDDKLIASASAYPMGDIGKWKLRHYSDKGTETQPPPFNSISSSVAIPLLVKPSVSEAAAATDQTEEKKKKSGHTGDRDWNRYGNTGSTFFLLCGEDKIYGKQAFLKNAKWYVEFSFDQPDLWLSSDWLDEAQIKGPALRGRGKDVHAKLVTLVGRLKEVQFEQTLVGMFHNLEVKVPGTLSFTKDDWKPV